MVLFRQPACNAVSLETYVGVVFVPSTWLPALGVQTAGKPKETGHSEHCEDTASLLAGEPMIHYSDILLVLLTVWLAV